MRSSRAATLASAPGRRAGLALCAALAVGCAALTAACAAVTGPSTLSMPGGKPVQGGALDATGRHVALSTLRGKVVLLDFFATWCEPCKKGLPATQALVEANTSRGLVGWAVSLDDQQALVAPFVEELKLRLPAWFDEGGKLADELGVEKLPTAVLLDRKGVVRFVRYGAAEESEAELARALEQLLRER